jgi:hypothetical protein
MASEVALWGSEATDVFQGFGAVNRPALLPVDPDDELLLDEATALLDALLLDEATALLDAAWLLLDEALLEVPCPVWPPVPPCFELIWVSASSAGSRSSPPHAT